MGTIDWLCATEFQNHRTYLRANAGLWFSEPAGGASYTDLQQTMELQEIHVSLQAIEERMTPEAAAFMSRMLEEMVAMVVQWSGVPNARPTIFHRRLSARWDCLSRA